MIVRSQGLLEITWSLPTLCYCPSRTPTGLLHCHCPSDAPPTVTPPPTPALLPFRDTFYGVVFLVRMCHAFLPSAGMKPRQGGDLFWIQNSAGVSCWRFRRGLPLGLSTQTLTHPFGVLLHQPPDL